MIELADLPVPNAHGWYRDDVTVRWTCDDAVSGPVRPDDLVTLSTEGSGQLLTGTCADHAGRTSSDTVGALNLDRTAPAVAFGEHPATYTVDRAVDIGCVSSDALSGVDTDTCRTIRGDAWTFGLGEHGYAAEATDRAGNPAATATAFTVEVTTASLCTLTMRFVTKESFGRQLCKTLEQADDMRLRGLDAGRAKKLEDYRQKLAQKTGKDVDAASADVLSGFSQAL